jgi:hypothetical protein
MANLTDRNRKLIERLYHEMWNRFDKSLIPVLLTHDRVEQGQAHFGRRGCSSGRGSEAGGHGTAPTSTLSMPTAFERMRYRRALVIGGSPEGESLCCICERVNPASTFVSQSAYLR